MFKEQIKWQWMTSEPIRNAMGQDILKEAMALVDADEEMPEEQAMALVQQLPEPRRSALMRQMHLAPGSQTNGQRPAMGMGAAPGGALQGSLQAAIPRQPGGPKPQEELA